MAGMKQQSRDTKTQFIFMMEWEMESNLWQTTSRRLKLLVEVKLFDPIAQSTTSVVR
jgi:hypothetical protein